MAIFAEVLSEIKDLTGSYYSINGEVKNKSMPITVYAYNRLNGYIVYNPTIIFNGVNYQLVAGSNYLGLKDDYFVVGLDPNKVVNGTIADLPSISLYRTPVYEY